MTFTPPPDSFFERLNAIGIALSTQQVEALQNYLAVLDTRRKEINLIGHVDADLGLNLQVTETRALILEESAIAIGGDIFGADTTA